MKENSLGGVGFPPPPATISDLWEQLFQRLWAPGWLHCPTFVCSEIVPVHQSECYCGAQPATDTQSIQMLLPLSMQLHTFAQRRLCWTSGVQGEKSCCSDVVLLMEMGGCPLATHPATRYQGETGASIRTCYLHTSELPALFLAAASWNKCHRKKKTH